MHNGERNIKQNRFIIDVDIGSLCTLLWRARGGGGAGPPLGLWSRSWPCRVVVCWQIAHYIDTRLNEWLIDWHFIKYCRAGDAATRGQVVPTKIAQNHQAIVICIVWAVGRGEGRRASDITCHCWFYTFHCVARSHYSWRFITVWKCLTSTVSKLVKVNIK